MGALPAVVLLLLGYSVMPAAAQPGVCYHSVASVQRTSRIVYTAIRETYTYQCWLFRCNGVRYRAVSSIQYRVVNRIQRRCCDGFKGDGYQCERVTGSACEGCETPFTCSANNTCVCSNPGLTGPNCTEDVNECVEYSNWCEQLCTNLVGNYSCSCGSDYSLAEDRRSCLARPHNTAVTHASATIFRLEWELPQLNLRDGSLVSYTISCTPSRLSGIEGQRVIHSITRSPYNIASLKPNIQYTCCVQAVTTNGNTPSSCATATTLEDAPGDAPNVTAEAIGSSTILVTWKHPLMPNGMITGYQLYVNFNNGSGIVSTKFSARSSSYYIVNLHPHQHITISMSAQTAVGEGPHSLGITVITPEEKPTTVATAAPESKKSNNQNDNSLPIIAGVVPLALVLLICIVFAAIIAVCGWRKIRRDRHRPQISRHMHNEENYLRGMMPSPPPTFMSTNPFPPGDESENATVLGTTVTANMNVDSDGQY